MGMMKRIVAGAAEGDSAERIAEALGVGKEWVERVMEADGFQIAVEEWRAAGTAHRTQQPESEGESGE